MVLRHNMPCLNPLGHWWGLLTFVSCTTTNNAPVSKELDNHGGELPVSSQTPRSNSLLKSTSIYQLLIMMVKSTARGHNLLPPFYGPQA
ncbi:hypothetical protein AVEN_158750-1 [Araneus ventricosus]|uniref:Uncharacterized protein n=1 Tax=Araneus ventricosus TaxID=182803 RepID=A0A4Y2TK17_ARAVE|nr:hypothetical protein AVEN_158750-1 [Araneus ventricosus]